MKSRVSLNTRSWYAGVHLPHNAVVTFMVFYYNTNDAAASMDIAFSRNTLGTSTIEELAAVTAIMTGGSQSTEDTTITNATIDNTTYSYFCKVNFNNIATVNDARIIGVKITYTVLVPLP